MNSSPHSFHIPVMGTGFTMDSPLRVARYGIDSVVSLGDDLLMEEMLKSYCQKEKRPFNPVDGTDDDARALRVTAWLDFLDESVKRQVSEMRNSPLHPGSEIWRYYALLPEGDLKDRWYRMLEMPEGFEKARAEAALRTALIPGHIDVNIMTKVDRAFTPTGVPLAPDSTDALAGLRGFGKSKLDATVVFSAGMNPRLYGYLTSFDDFFPDKDGYLKKRVCLKVSDYRSAEIQGRFLAKKGVWISEFRVESGLNCGGHAFAPQGQLLGPILEEFNSKKSALKDELFMIWSKALSAKRGLNLLAAPKVKLSVQGGVGTAAEHEQMINRFGASSVGWGSPFLLVPEATLVDAEHRKKLCEATEEDVELSDASPLGIPFWSLRTSSSEELRRKRIAEGKPGSPCAHSYLIFNTEFGPKPICSSSRNYQRQKLASLEQSGLKGEALEEAKKIVTAHACICMDLGGAAENELGIKAQAPVAVCPGPNIVWFKREASLEEMLGHIYGRDSLISEELRATRPHMFLTELKLSVDYMIRELRRSALGLAPKSAAYFEEYKANMIKGMDYYRERSLELFGKGQDWLERAQKDLRDSLANIDFAQAAMA
jgi:hypothetical protein